MMRKRLTCCLLGLCALLSTLAYGRELNKSLFCPIVEGGFALEKPIPPALPTYKVGSKHQIWIRGGWTGMHDYSADVRFCWDDNALGIAMDIKDDVYFPSRSQDIKDLSGDYILLIIQPKSAAPNVIKEAFRVLLIPDPKDSFCEAKVIPGETPMTLIGTPTTALKKTEGGYQLLFSLSTRLWNDKPAIGKDVDIQIVFGDSDTSGKVEHTMALFPKRGNLGTFLDSRGHLHFVGNQWIHVYPKRAKFDQGKLDMKLECGNLSDKPVSLGMAILSSDGDLATAFDNLKTLPAGEFLHGDTLSIDLPKLKPSETYVVNAQIGEAISPASFKIKADPNLKNMVYCPEWTENRLRLKQPDLPVTKRSTGITDTLKYLAGGGSVIWRAGAYDGSSREFPEMMRENGTYSIELSEGVADPKTIPWALFGGVDSLDGMNEPLELKLPQGLAANRPSFQPEYPLTFDYLIKNKKGKQMSLVARRLLLIGLVCTNSGGDQFPIIQVKNQKSKVLLEERLRPGYSQFSAQPHSYVLRVWLTSQDTSIRIENVNERGARAEIDFMALIGGSDEPLTMPQDQPRIAFEGGAEATMFNKMLMTNAFLAQNYLMTPDGKTQSSLPGGKTYLFNLRDHMALVEELSAWYNSDQIKSAMGSISLAPRWERKGFESDDPVSAMLGVIAVWNHWRKNGMDKVILDTHWFTVVLGGLGKVKDSVTSNSMGLMGGSGEFGTSKGDRGVSLPLSHIAMSALACGVEMAKANGINDKAEEWEALITKIQDGIDTQLTAAPGGEKVSSSLLYPALHGLPEQKGVTGVIPQGTLLYGKTANKEIILYNDDIRVFDTPYLYAGLPYLPARTGLTLSAAERALFQKSTLFLRSSTVLKQKDFLEYNLVTYKSIATQFWMITALMLSDNVNYAGKMLEGLIRYNFDEYASIPEKADIEVSPFALEEKLNVSEKGDNLGGTLDESNALSVSLLMKLSRLMAGIDDHDHSTLKVTPRLPAEWNKVSVEDWNVCHTIDNSVKNTTIDMTYRRAGTGYKLELQSINFLQNIELRIGPFRSSDRRIQVTMDGKTKLEDTVNINGTRWVILNEKRVRELNIEAVPGRF